MSVDDKINNEFFIIDSDNLDSVKDRLYGFAVADNEIIKNGNVDKYDDIQDIGSYVLIKNNGGVISISQDFMGSYGLCIYKKDDYFAISNSFLKLIDYLKDSHEFSYNEDYGNSLLVPRTLCSLSFDETLVNEIELIARNVSISIDVETGKITYDETDYNENSISVDTKEGIEILDKWFNKWIGIIRSIKSKTDNMTMDLTGGFDTRIILALMLSSGIDMNSINVHSINNTDHTHGEDFIIASKIAESFGFKLNRNLEVNYSNYPDIDSVLNLSSYVKLGFNNQFNFKLNSPNEPIFTITGFGGECLRHYPKDKDIDVFKDYRVNLAKKYGSDLANSTDKILTNGIAKVESRFNADKVDMVSRYYKETRLRNHFGKLSVEAYISNYFYLSPIIDPDLFNLKIYTEECRDDLLLMSLILVRYCPQLLDFEVEGGRKFNEQTIEYARKINEKYPFKPKDHPMLSKVSEGFVKSQSECEKIEWSEMNDHLRDVFESNLFKHEFEKYFSSEMYDRIHYSINHQNYFPIQDAIPAFGIIKVLNSIQYNKTKNQEFASQWFDSFLDDGHKSDGTSSEFSVLLKKFATARVDIKNNNSESTTIEILENSESNLNVQFPKWFRDENGKGCVIESAMGYLDLKFKCIGDGKLSINLRGINFLDKNRNRFPIYVDITKFVLNGDEVIGENRLVCHDEPYVLNIDVNDLDIISIHLEWMPVNPNSSTNRQNNDDAGIGGAKRIMKKFIRR